MSADVRTVYFAERDGRIKIGIAGIVRNRMQALGTTLLGACPGTFADEKALHLRFAVHALGHEWFTDCPEIRDYIATLPPHRGVSDNDPAVLTLTEVAAKLRLGRTTLYEQVKAGTFPLRPIQVGAKKLLFSARAVDRLINGETEAVAS